jgi:serine/threonine protein kinase
MEAREVVATAMKWCKRSGKFAPGTQKFFEEFVVSLQETAVDPSFLSGGEPLGIGAFGVIERDTLNGEPVAVKYVKSEVMAGPKKLSQVMHEVSLELKIIKQIQHPRIVNFGGTVVRFPKDNEPVKDWSIGLILELCEGGEVNNLLHTKKVKFSMQEKMSMVRDTAAGVAYLHSQVQDMS